VAHGSGDELPSYFDNTNISRMREKAKQAVWRGSASVDADMGDDLERGPADNHIAHNSKDGAIGAAREKRLELEIVRRAYYRCRLQGNGWCLAYE
jgi:hypothetical protein